MATKSIVGEKVGMTQVWADDGRVVPVTVLRVQTARIVQVKTPESDGYSAVQVTYGTKDARKLTKPKAGHFAKAGVEAGTRLVELRMDDVSTLEIGGQIGADTFAAGDKVDVTAISKGKGFAGGMKRHGFKGLPASHGAHRVHRHPGSIGACATPSRVLKGTKMAGRMGGGQVTTQNLEIVRADAEAGVVLVRGAVPGPKGAVVIITNASKLTKGASA
ncbi:MAG: 50S ribosomal protein L3 [Actinomycetota bacterium]|nr:50S ribosomal protein L3 [Acidimicrobiia bacterium]MDQ3293544.1 50S ribosomal protein L3 [Actinomycetota bacterium]